MMFMVYTPTFISRIWTGVFYQILPIELSNGMALRHRRDWRPLSQTVRRLHGMKKSKKKQ
jgi:hypothetical protein